MEVRSSQFKSLQNYYIQAVRQNPNNAFVDKDFPPKLEPMIFDKNKPPDDQETYTWRQQMEESANIGQLKWIRASDLAKLHNLQPRMVVQGVTRFDINQGNVGNCWFLAGAAHLVERPDLFSQVVPSDQDFQNLYGGIFHFYFWHFHQWTEVIIDDFLPCVRRSHNWWPMFTKNYRHVNEFWSPLLEKAYAKLNGSYEDIEGGFTRWAMVDLTGGLGFCIDFKKDDFDHHELYQIMDRLQNYDTTFGCHGVPQIPGKTNNRGLEWRHAYTVVKSVKVQNRRGLTLYLIKLNNPHGEGSSEWQGEWSDKDEQNWGQLQPNDQQLRSSLREGDFWMNFEDFIRYFQYLDVCLIPPVNDTLLNLSLGMKTKAWTVLSSPLQRWTIESSAGVPPGYPDFWLNPQITFNVTEKDAARATEARTVFFCLTRVTETTNDRWSLTSQLNMDIYHLTDGQALMLNSANAHRARHVHNGRTAYSYSGWRDLSVLLTLKPGRYCAIPWRRAPPDATHVYRREEKFIVRVAVADEELFKPNDVEADNEKNSCCDCF